MVAAQRGTGNEVSPDDAGQYGPLTASVAIDALETLGVPPGGADSRRVMLQKGGGTSQCFESHTQDVPATHDVGSANHFQKCVKELVAAHEAAMAELRTELAPTGASAEASAAIRSPSPVSPRQAGGGFPTRTGHVRVVASIADRGSMDHANRCSINRSLPVTIDLSRRIEFAHDASSVGNDGATDNQGSHRTQSNQSSSRSKQIWRLRNEWKLTRMSQVERQLSVYRSASILMNEANKDNGIIAGSGCMQRFLIHPNSMKKLAWDCVSMLLLAYDIVVMPFVWAFRPSDTTLQDAMTIFTPFFWSFDMVLSSLSGFEEGKNVIMIHKRILLKYAMTWFPLDVIIVSLDWAFIFIEFTEDATDPSAARLGRSVRILRFVRTIRLIRALKLKRIIQTIQDHITTESFSIGWSIVKVVISLVISNHLVACLWYFLGCEASEGFATSWVEKYDMEERTIAYRYATSLHWSLTQFTPASMEVFPQNSVERIFAVIVLLSAMVTFSSFVSMLTTSMNQLRSISSNESRQFWLLRRYLRDWKISHLVGRKINRYLEHAYQQQKSRIPENEVVLLNLLSEPLREELRHEKMKMHLSGHVLWTWWRNNMRFVSKALRSVSLARGDVVFSAGEQAANMTFVGSGMFEYMRGSLVCGVLQDQVALTPSISSSDNETLTSGQWVSEAALWTHWVHLGELQAATECQAIFVNAATFVDSIRSNRILCQKLRRYAVCFLDGLNDCEIEDLTDLAHKHISSRRIFKKADWENDFEELRPAPDKRRSSWRAISSILGRRSSATTADRDDDSESESPE